MWEKTWWFFHNPFQPSHSLSLSLSLSLSILGWCHLGVDWLCHLGVQDLSLQICQLTSPEKKKKGRSQNCVTSKISSTQKKKNTHKVFVQDQRFFFQFYDIKNLAKFSKKKLTKVVKIYTRICFSYNSFKTHEKGPLLKSMKWDSLDVTTWANHYEYGVLGWESTPYLCIFIGLKWVALYLIIMFHPKYFV
jgi:hypothetical protein